MEDVDQISAKLLLDFAGFLINSDEKDQNYPKMTQAVKLLIETQ